MHLWFKATTSNFCLKNDFSALISKNQSHLENKAETSFFFFWQKKIDLQKCIGFGLYYFLYTFFNFDQISHNILVYLLLTLNE